jgi:hypothetical protein
MRRMISALLDYSGRIGRRWVLLLFLAIDAVALISQVFIPKLLLPAWAYGLILIIGLFIAAYQEHTDLLAQRPTTPPPPPPYELLPSSYQVSFSQDISSVGVWLYAVNFQAREVVLDKITVTTLQLSAGPSLKDIRNHGIVSIPAKQCVEVWCHRDLADGEIRALRRMESKCPINASVHLAATGLSGRKTLHLDVPNRSLNGWFSGTPPDLA